MLNIEQNPTPFITSRYRTRPGSRGERNVRTQKDPLVEIHFLLRSSVDQDSGPLSCSDALLAVESGLARVQSGQLALLALAQLLADEVLARGHHLAVLLALAVPRKLARQPTLGEDPLSALPDLLHSLHGLDGSGHQVSVVLDGDVALLGELGQDEGGVDDHLLALGGTTDLGPLHTSRLSLSLEVLVGNGDVSFVLEIDGTTKA